MTFLSFLRRKLPLAAVPILVNFALALLLKLCCLDDQIGIGILIFVPYRLSLWLAPFLVTALVWIPVRRDGTALYKCLLHMFLLIACGGLYLLCGIF